MIRRLSWALVAASLFGLAPGDAGARKPAIGGLDATLAKAVTFCEGAASREAGARFELASPDGIEVHDSRSSALDIPDLVKRFADSQPAGRMASPERFYLHFRSNDAQVWAVVYRGLPACSIMVTGAAGDMPAAGVRLAGSLQNAGWQLHGFSPATAAMPLAKHLLTKKIPVAGTPDFGVFLSLRALTGDSTDPNGVQMEMRFLGGQIRPPPPGSSEVEVDVGFRPGRQAGKGTSSSPDSK